MWVLGWCGFLVGVWVFLVVFECFFWWIFLFLLGVCVFGCWVLVCFLGFGFFWFVVVFNCWVSGGVGDWGYCGFLLMGCLGLLS